MQRDDELQRFKSDIDLIQYCAGCGYEIDKKESSRTSTIMRRGEEKIGVAVDTDSHWVYSDLRNDGKGGSIIDFVQSNQGLNLGEVRKELRGARSYIEQIPFSQRAPKPMPSNVSRQAVQHAFIKTRLTAGRHEYLQRERGIESSTLNDPRFVSMVKIDDKGNAIFPHYDQDGLTGYEIRNTEFKGFSTHGEKTLWHSANLANAREVIFVEGAINALSHAQLHPELTDTAYVSFGGNMSRLQQELVILVMQEATERGAVIVFATDADDAGENHAQRLKSLAPANAVLERDRPEFGDWNDLVIDAANKPETYLVPKP